MNALRASLALIALGMSGGCTHWPLSSKWAMDDRAYREKYSAPYGNNKFAQMVKQTIVARHVGEKVGVQFAGTGGDSPNLGTWEISALRLGKDGVLESRLGLGSVIGGPVDDRYYGLSLGGRVQVPARLGPFVGVGAFVGGATHEETTDSDGVDNDGNGRVDEDGEDITVRRAIWSVYPEAGTHFWINSRTRLSTVARYYLSEVVDRGSSHDDDQWSFGLELVTLLGHKDVAHVPSSCHGRTNAPAPEAVSSPEFSPAKAEQRFNSALDEVAGPTNSSNEDIDADF